MESHYHSNSTAIKTPKRNENLRRIYDESKVRDIYVVRSLFRHGKDMPKTMTTPSKMHCQTVSMMKNVQRQVKEKKMKIYLSETMNLRHYSNACYLLNRLIKSNSCRKRSSTRPRTPKRKREKCNYFRNIKSRRKIMIFMNRKRVWSPTFSLSFSLYLSFFLVHACSCARCVSLARWWTIVSRRRFEILSNQRDAWLCSECVASRFEVVKMSRRRNDKKRKEINLRKKESMCMPIDLATASCLSRSFSLSVFLSPHRLNVCIDAEYNLRLSWQWWPSSLVNGLFLFPLFGQQKGKNVSCIQWKRNDKKMRMFETFSRFFVVESRWMHLSNCFCFHQQATEKKVRTRSHPWQYELQLNRSNEKSEEGKERKQKEKKSNEESWFASIVRETVDPIA